MGIKSHGVATIWDNPRKQLRMGIITNVKVAQLVLGLCLVLAPESSSSSPSTAGSSPLCPHSRQYWHEQRERCLNCTTCPVGEIVIRPCQVHRDAQCGPISELNIDWSFLTRREHKHHLELDKAAAAHHKHQQHGHGHGHGHSDGKHQHKHQQGKHKHHHKTFKEKLELHALGEHPADPRFLAPAPENLEMGSSSQHPQQQPQPLFLGSPGPGKVSQLPESAALHHSHTATGGPPTEPFSAFERVVWDWQVVVLVLAVFACVLFFLVTGVYSIHHIRQWRRFKKGYKPDVEEAYARRSLMLPGHLDSQASPPSMESYALQQSLCMEQLLVLKTQEDLGTQKGNFYIVRDKATEIQEGSQ